ncbi:Fatty acid hydroxylase superfamily protein [compost metagenome]
MPPSASIPLATAFYFLFQWLVPGNMLDGFFGGFILGYLFYDMTHYMLHHAQFKSGIWKKIKQHHMLHHYNDSTKGYGVTSDLWDKIFGSGFLKK